MILESISRFQGSLRGALGGFCGMAILAFAMPSGAAEDLVVGRIEPCGVIELLRKGAAEGTRTQLAQPLREEDRVRTFEDSHAILYFNDGTVVQLGEASTYIVHHAQPLTTLGAIGRLARGVLYYFSGHQPFEMQIETEHATAAPRGTEFVLEVNDERTLLIIVDGEATLQNAQGTVQIGSKGVAVAEKGRRPQAVLEAVNVVQWWLHYPGVLHPGDLRLAPEREKELARSLAAYHSGDLRAALTSYPNYPEPTRPDDDATRIYLAALYLGVGEVGKAEALLESVPADSSPARGLRWLIAAVQHRVKEEPGPARSATEALGLSYYLQARQPGNPGLQAALKAATNAAALAPKSGFAWARVAELEFSFGRNQPAARALTNALALSPSNAQAFALQGFLLSARERIAEARRAFDESLRLDRSLGDAWLGRGLVRIRQGDLRGGREDLRIAVSTEANRSALHSYLGKALMDAGDLPAAYAELRRARELDPKDPTPWLYSAFLNEQSNRVNTAIEDLQQSQKLNDNRALFRSRLRLDQDQSVRSAGLARLYRRDGLLDVSQREAARAVALDYADYSGHLFLAESYDALRDPSRLNLFYETAWYDELLLANLLAPVGAGAFSQGISQQEYTRLFERDRLSLTSLTEYRTDGQLHELATESGTFGRSSWAVDADYQTQDGVYPNTDFRRLDFHSQLKQQVTDQDTALLFLDHEDFKAGDVRQIPHQELDPTFRLSEVQWPFLFGGWRHEWSPDSQTLLLVGGFRDDQNWSDAQVAVPTVENGTPGAATDLTAHSELSLTIYSAEASQILRTEALPELTHVVGVRGQLGTFNAFSTLDVSASRLLPEFLASPQVSRTGRDFHRLTLYDYESWTALENLTLTAGLDYDTVHFPENFRNPPFVAGGTTRSRWLPKVSLVWDIVPDVTFRALYARSLGGVSLDESVRLEPVQLAGFVQNYRTVIPEGLTGSVSAHDLEVRAGALDFTLPTRTYLGLEAESLESKADEEFGGYALSEQVDQAGVVQSSSQTITVDDRLAFKQLSLTARADQLLAQEWAAGGWYRYADARLDSSMVLRSARTQLHEVEAHLTWNHPSGLFGRAESRWDYQQTPSESFTQINVEAGYRLFRGRGELTMGGLNLLNQEPKFEALNGFYGLPLKAVFFVRFKLDY